jgi:hypothetical protein
MVADQKRYEPAVIDKWARLVQSEYRESPGLRLTCSQVQRFWGLDRETCQRVLDRLEAEQFLKKTSANAYARADMW